MSKVWLQNLCGMTLSDEEMQLIPRPLLELNGHVVIKSIQMFGLLGTCAVGPLVAVARKDTRNWQGVKQKMRIIGFRSCIFGVVAGPLLTYLKIRNEQDEYKIWDRCYRLRHNRGQVRVDQFSVIGAASGAVAGALTGAGSTFGGLIGMSGGIIFAAAYNNMFKK